MIVILHSWLLSQSLKWLLELCESSATRRCLGEQWHISEQSWTWHSVLLRSFQEGHEDVGSKKNSFFFFFLIWVSPTPRIRQCRFWLGEEITGEGALSSVKCSTDSCQLGANYMVLATTRASSYPRRLFILLFSFNWLCLTEICLWKSLHTSSILETEPFQGRSLIIYLPFPSLNLA